MTTVVVRYKCDWCGKTHMTKSIASWCEWMCEGDAKAIEARRAATGNTDAVADESAAPKGFAQKDSA